MGEDEDEEGENPEVPEDEEEENTEEKMSELEIKNRDLVKDTFVNLRSPLLSMIDLARKQDNLKSEFEKTEIVIKQNEDLGCPNPQLCEKLEDQRTSLVALQREREKVQNV